MRTLARFIGTIISNRIDALTERSVMGDDQEARILRWERVSRIVDRFC